MSTHTPKSTPFEGGYGSIHLNNVSGLIRNYYSQRANGKHEDYPELKIQNKAQYNEFVHEMYIDLGIWTTKDMLKESKQAADKSRPRFFQKEHDVPQDMKKRVEKIVKFVRSQIKTAESMADIPVPVPPSVKKNAPKTKKAESGEKAQAILDSDTITKTDKIISMHFEYGFAPKKIAEMMELSSGRVNNTLTKERKRLRSEGIEESQ